VPEASFLDHRPQHLDGEKRIAFGVSVQEREELGSDFLLQDGLDPEAKVFTR
jgi:hypothetical protein